MGLELIRRLLLFAQQLFIASSSSSQSLMNEPKIARTTLDDSDDTDNEVTFMVDLSIRD